MKTIYMIRPEYFIDDDGKEYFGESGEYIHVGDKAAKQLLENGAAEIVGKKDAFKISYKRRASLLTGEFGEGEDLPKSRRQRRRRDHYVNDKSRLKKTRNFSR